MQLLILPFLFVFKWHDDLGGDEMRLTKEQQEIYDGGKGKTYAKIMETLVRYGELFGAEEMAEVTGKYGHLVTSFGLQVIDPVYKLMDELIEAGVVSKQKFTMDPRPLDKNVPSGPLQDLVFYKAAMPL